jgi:hypothetical protein
MNDASSTPHAAAFADLPAEPEIPAQHRAEGTLSLRWRDITQDGRLSPMVMPHGTSRLWETLVSTFPGLSSMWRTGALPILTRMVAVGAGGPIGIAQPVSVRGSVQLAHGIGANGAVDRLFLNMWLRFQGKKGSTYDPQPQGKGETIDLGRLLVEHTVTRPFGAPDKRKVLKLEAEGLPEVPPERYDARPFDEILLLPKGVRALDDDLVPDVVPVIFGVRQTDSNQHVNSLVYIERFEDAALRRFADRGLDVAVMPYHYEIGYRKPAFAGDRLRIALRAFSGEGRAGAVGVFLPDGGDAAAKPYAYVKMMFCR